MHTFVATVALLLGLGLCTFAGWHTMRAQKMLRPIRRETESVRRQVAALKVARAEGTIDDDAYRERRRALAKQLAELTGPEQAATTMKPRTWLLGALGLAGMALGTGMLFWPMQPPTPGRDPVPSASTAASAAHPLRTDQVEHAVEQMRERVKQNPKDAAAWAMLAHSYDMLGRRAEASATYSRLIELVPDDPQVLVDAADSMALAHGRQLQGEPMQLIQRALALDPKNLKALSLAGTEAFDRNDPAQAITYWQRARAQVTDAALARELDDRIAEARSLQSRAAVGAAARPVPAAASSATSASGSVSGRITLSAKLKAQVAPGDALFIFARPADGSRMPVALMRRQASELPIEFTLDDSMAMVPQSRLSAQSRVIIGARISKQADALPKPGDLEGFSKPAAVGSKSVQLEIAEVVK
jgi:cytochrome c-type biogenesis protein CcmH